MTAHHRRKAVRVKTAKHRKASSTAWLQRQLNDPYVQRAKLDNYPSRSAYKLIEINRQFNLLRPGMRVCDLGSAPGGWSKVAAEIIKSTNEEPRVVALDCLDMNPIKGVVFIRRDFLDDDSPGLIADALGGEKPDVILSDMAAPVVGHRRTDHLRTMALAEAASEFAVQTLAVGGSFLVKVFQGGAQGSVLEVLKRRFERVRHVKPPASRKESVELYVMGQGLRPCGCGQRPRISR